MFRQKKKKEHGKTRKEENLGKGKRDGMGKYKNIFGGKALGKEGGMERKSSEEQRGENKE
jgi:hypothetical protein